LVQKKPRKIKTRSDFMLVIKTTGKIFHSLAANVNMWCRWARVWCSHVLKVQKKDLLKITNKNLPKSFVQAA